MVSSKHILRNSEELNRLSERIHVASRGRRASDPASLDRHLEACREFHERFDSLMYPGGCAVFNRVRQHDPHALETAVTFLLGLSQGVPLAMAGALSTFRSCAIAIGASCDRLPGSANQAGIRGDVQSNAQDWTRSLLDARITCPALGRRVEGAEGGTAVNPQGEPVRWRSRTSRHVD